jgi:hypothetical protein
MDFERYNFVIGIAASANFADDLLARVITHDEFTEGRFSVENMPGSAALAELSNSPATAMEAWSAWRRSKGRMSQPITSCSMARSLPRRHWKNGMGWSEAGKQNP